MIHVDSALLNFTERLCHAFQRLTGRTNAWLAFQLTNLSIVVYFVWVALQFLASDALPRTVLAILSGGVLFLLSQTVFKVPVEVHENSAYRRVASGARNPRRVRDVLLRVSFLTLSIVLLYPVFFVYVHLGRAIVVLTYSLIVLTTVVLYLLACDPLPPCPGRVTEWLRGLAPSRVPRAESPPAESRRARALRADVAARSPVDSGSSPM